MRPKVICHIMGSVDGRLMNKRWTPPCDGRPQSDLLAVYAGIGKELGTSAWMFGLNTARAFFPDIYRPADGIPAHASETFCAPEISERRFVVSDPDGTIRYDKNTVRGDGIIALLGRRVSEDYLRHLRSAGISYTFAGDDGCDLREALESLHDRFGITSLSLQHHQRGIPESRTARRTESGRISGYRRTGGRALDFRMSRHAGRTSRNGAKSGISVRATNALRGRMVEVSNTEIHMMHRAVYLYRKCAQSRFHNQNYK
ncbi:MAG: hypothetical protein NC322_05190 [Alistipes senegalensis]|nr:hypothetical protein [Alistipes senegalensis]